MTTETAGGTSRGDERRLHDARQDTVRLDRPVVPQAPAAPVRRRRRVGSARLRILGWYVLLLCFAIGVEVLVERQILLARLDAQINDGLVQEIDELRLLIGGEDASGACVRPRAADGSCPLGNDPETRMPFGRDVDAIFTTFLTRNLPDEFETLLTFVDGQAFLKTQGAPVEIDTLPAVQALGGIDDTRDGEITVPGAGRLRYLAVPVTFEQDTLGVFVVAYFLDLSRDEIDDLSRVAAGVGFGTILIASALAWGIAGRVLAPVRTISDTARAISDTDLSRRIPQPRSNDEIADLAETFNDMLGRLETAFTTQRNFIDDAGHELRTPITIIRGHLELLGDDPVEREETVAIVTDELDRMNRMVDDLLVLAKAEHADFLDLQVLDVANLTDALLAKAAALGAREWRLDNKGVGTVVADRQRVTQAVMQLAVNATQHTEEGEPITLGSDIEAGEVRFWVRDEGPGVPLDEQDRIFERFARSPSARRRSDGAGLGLAIVRAIADAHSGRVELRSLPGAGATFSLIIPLDPPRDEGAEL